MTSLTCTIMHNIIVKYKQHCNFKFLYNFEATQLPMRGMTYSRFLHDTNKVVNKQLFI